MNDEQIAKMLVSRIFSGRRAAIFEVHIDRLELEEIASVAASHGRSAKLKEVRRELASVPIDQKLRGLLARTCDECGQGDVFSGRILRCEKCSEKAGKIP